MSKDIAAKKAKKRREKLKRVRKKQQLQVGLMLVLMIAALTVFVWLYRSDLFRVKRIEISGNKHLSDKKVDKIAEIEPTDSLVRIPLEKVKNRLLKNRWIKDVEIKRSFPNTVKIQVTERKAIAIVPVEDGNAVVDKEGLVLDNIQDIDNVDLVLIRDLDVTEAKVGQKISAKSFSNACLCLSNLDDSLRRSLSIVSAPSVDKLSLYTKKGVEIIYGKAEDFKKKNYIIKKILSDNGDEVIFIDIRVVSNPVVKKRP